MTILALYLLGALEIQRTCYVHHWTTRSELVCREHLVWSDSSVNKIAAWQKDARCGASPLR